MPFLFALVLGICKIIFPRELLYILNSYSIQDPQLPWQCLWQKREGERGREGEQKIGKSIQSWQGNNWFHYIQPADSLYHQWQGDGRHRERACVCVWAVINYCWGQGWGGRTHWLNETKPTVYPSDISLPPSQESEGAQTNPIILIKYFLVLQRTKRWAVYTAKALIRSPCSVQTRSLG